MELSKLLELLKDALNEVPGLRELPYGNSDYPLWRHKVEDVLRAGFVGRSVEYSRFADAVISFPTFVSDDLNQKEYLRQLEKYETALKSIVWELEVIGAKAEPEAETPGEVPKAFIAHGGKTAARDKLEDFLRALGVTPIIVEEQPSEGRSKDKNVEHYLKQCDCAIILATKGDVDGRTGEFIPRGNILIEIGRSQEILPDRMIYLLEEGAKFPTDIDEKVWGRFTKESMDKAFIKIARELRAFGLIRPTKRVK